jgi:hypothetical protein
MRTQVTRRATCVVATALASLCIVSVQSAALAKPAFAEVTNESAYAVLEVHGAPPDLGP